MKKINLLVCTLAIAGLGFTACSDDDSNSNSSTSIAGTYSLEEVNTSATTDFDQDNVSHVNQMDESKCYDDGKVTLNSDNTFKYVITNILINDGVAGCANSQTVTGVYTSQPAADPTNALITLTYNDNGTTVTRQFTKIGKELTYTDNTIVSTYPDRDENGAAVEVPGSREYVYKK